MKFYLKDLEVRVEYSSSYFVGRGYEIVINHVWLGKLDIKNELAELEIKDMEEFCSYEADQVRHEHGTVSCVFDRD